MKLKFNLLPPVAMRRNILYTCALFMIAGCAENGYVGPEAEKEEPAISKAISFGGGFQSMTRATKEDYAAAQALGFKFKVFGMKTVNSQDQRVFSTSPDATDGAPYWLWYEASSANKTASNSSDWEYVGESGGTYGTTNYQVTLQHKQTIKYWDFSASEYNFQAWSDLNAANSEVSVTAISKNTMTLSATPAQLGNFWLSDLQKGAPATFANNPVQLTFRKAATKVRLGIYETVSGYSVRNVKFHYNNNTISPTTETGAKTYAILDGKFVGTSNPTTPTSFNVKYEGTPLRAVLEPSGTSENTTYFNFGEFTPTNGVLGEASTSPTWAGGNGDYTWVFPNTKTENIADMTLKVDFELYDESSGEVIKVENKTAIVPAAYMTWKPNYAYTYLFKITDDQLTPITFDAVVIDDGEGHQETITTVPSEGKEVSITTLGIIMDGTTFKNYVTGKNEYQMPTGTDKLDIYAIFTDTKTNANPVVLTPQLMDNDKANFVKVYAVKYKDGATEAEKTAHPITELSVANAIEHTGGLITATHINTLVNDYFATAPAPVTYVPGENGVNKSINALKLEGAKAAGKYAVEIVTYDEVTGLTTNTSSVKGYYTVNANGEYSAVPGEDPKAQGGTKYYKQIKTYKVITVVSGS